MSLKKRGPLVFNSVQLLSRVPTLCDPMDCSMPGFPVHHQHPELAQTHVHCVNDAIQPSHPLSSSSPPAFNLSQHQGLFQWVSSSLPWHLWRGDTSPVCEPPLGGSRSQGPRGLSPSLCQGCVRWRKGMASRAEGQRSKTMLLYV